MDKGVVFKRLGVTTHEFFPELGEEMRDFRWRVPVPWGYNGICHCLKKGPLFVSAKLRSGLFRFRIAQNPVRISG